MYVFGISCTPVASISVISVVLSGSRFVPLFVHIGLLFFNGICQLIDIGLHTRSGPMIFVFNFNPQYLKL